MTVIICNLALLVLIDALDIWSCACVTLVRLALVSLTLHLACVESPPPPPSGGEGGSVLYTGNIRRVLVCFNAKALGNG